MTEKITTAKMKFATRDKLKDMKKHFHVRSYDAAINKMIETTTLKKLRKGEII